MNLYHIFSHDLIDQNDGISIKQLLTQNNRILTIK